MMKISLVCGGGAPPKAWAVGSIVVLIIQLPCVSSPTTFGWRIS